MAQLSTKFKIILIVFAVIIGLYVIQFIVSGMSSSSKREAFSNDEFDEEPNEKPKKRDHKKKKGDDDSSEHFDDEDDKKKTATDKEVKLDLLEKVEDVFNKLYPESDKKPVIFDMLTRKEHFKELKEKYESGEGIDKYVKNFVKQTMANIESDKIDQKKTETFEELMDKPFNHINESLDKQESRSKLLSDLEDLVTKIGKIQNEIKKIQDDEPVKKTEAKKDDPKKDDDKKKEKEKFKDGSIIEGFENRFSYASY